MSQKMILNMKNQDEIFDSSNISSNTDNPMIVVATDEFSRIMFIGLKSTYFKMLFVML